MQRKLVQIFLSEDIARLSFWGKSGMPIHARPRSINLPLTCKKSVSCHSSFLRYWTSWNPAIWSVESRSAGEGITKELEIYETYNLGWENKYHNNSPFKLLLGQSNDKIFKKKNNALFWGHFCRSTSKNEFPPKIRLCQLWNK